MSVATEFSKMIETPSISTTRYPAFFCFHDWIYFNSTFGLFKEALDKALLVPLRWSLIQPIRSWWPHSWGLHSTAEVQEYFQQWFHLKCAIHSLSHCIFFPKQIILTFLYLWELAQSGVKFPFLSLHICILFSSLELITTFFHYPPFILTFPSRAEAFITF